MTAAVDMGPARGVLAQVSQEIEALDGREHSTAPENKDRMRADATTTRKLLYAAHLAEMLQMALLTEYHRFKGEDPPAITT